MWEEVGSAIPVHSKLATSDPSDERLGPMLWDLARRYAGASYPQQLERMFDPHQATDPVTATSLILVKGATNGTPRQADTKRTSWFGSGGTRGGTLLAKKLTEFLLNLSVTETSAKRLMQIQHLGRGLYLAAVLAVLLGPIASRQKSEIHGVDEIGPLLVWGDTPPGPRDHPFVRASARSFQLLIDRNRAALAGALAEALDSQSLPKKLPPRQRRRVALQAQFIDGGYTVSQADKMIERLSSDAKVTIDGADPADRKWCSRVVESAYPAAFLTRGLRSMGRKVGFIGPDRGAGSPRFLAETPLLGTLVASVCRQQTMDFEDFVDRVRTNFGLIFGPGTQDDLAHRLGLWKGSAIGRRLLRDNQDALRQRLVRAGLAREYSDGHTEVSYEK
jgi:hypothetical protein